MTGVEILSRNEVVVETIFNWKTFWIATCVIFILFLIIGVNLLLNKEMYSDEFACMLKIGLVIALLFGWLFGYIFMPKPVKYRTEYEVFLTSNVSMEDFYSKYEVLKKDGRIYTVVKKEDSDYECN